MAAFFHHLFILFLLYTLLSLCQSTNPIGNYCGESYSGGATGANIGKVLADLASRAPLDGFAATSAGKGNNTIWGLAQCRGDVSAEDCSSCIADAVKDLPKTCPNQADARIWYDYCFMRIYNKNFIGQSDTGYALVYINTDSFSENQAIQFDNETGALMTKVRAQATAPGNHGLGRGKTQFTPYVTIYGLAECTRDLPRLPCAQCLSAAVTMLPTYCQFRKGCQIHYSSCSVRYEIYPFFFPLDASQSASAAAAKANTYLVILKP